MSIWNNFLNLFFPDLCLFCNNRLVNGERFICLSCMENLPYTNYHTVENNKLEQLFAGRFPFIRVASLAYFVKGGILQAVIHDLKYNNNPELGIYLGRISGRELVKSSFLSTVDCIIPVPLHPKRERQRGYNQAQKIAEGLFIETNIPVEDSLLKRTIFNVSQTQKSRMERWDNAIDIFTLEDSEKLENRHILLIDDVITTGSTLDSCVKAILKDKKNIKISIFSIAVAID